MSKVNIVLPVVHLNGTSRLSLIEEQQEVLYSLQDVVAKLKNAAPNMRDYYPVPGRWQEALEQHKRRLTTITDLIAEVTTHIDQLDDER